LFLRRALLSAIAALAVVLPLGESSAYASNSGSVGAENPHSTASQHVAAAAGNPTWIVQKTQFLTDKPVAGMPSSCTEGRLLLTTGKYNWGQLWDGLWRLEMADLVLLGGVYTMRTCLFPEDRIYRQVIWLLPDNELLAPINVTTYSDLWLGSRVITWGAFLDPLPPL
jgi:hypothetical protein